MRRKFGVTSVDANHEEREVARLEISGLAVERAALITATRPAILARSESFGRCVGFARNIRRILASTSCVRLR
ncbi:MAG TPA: hypothetical protein VHJ56_00125 [Candidatus Binatia bacterium]|nr:hypothetical protein [Candidatus Binatia bacterium]